MIRLAAILVTLLAVGAAPLQNQQGSRALAITHVGVVDTVAGTVLPDMMVLIRNDRIVSIEKGDAVPRGAEVVDGRNRFLIPGLWDMHVHLSYARASALPVLVAHGVTYVRDLGSDLAELDQWRGQIAANTVAGPTIFRSGPMLNGMEFNAYQLAVANDLEARIAVRTLKKVGVDFIKLHRRTSREAYFAIASEAKMLGLPFTGHVPMTVTPAEASDAGHGSIEHTETLFEGTFTTERAGKDLTAEIARWRETGASDLFAAFVRNGTPVDPTLVALTEVTRLLESGKPTLDLPYLAASARAQGEKSLAGMRPQAQKVLAEMKPRLREIQAVTGLMNRSGVKLLSGTDLSFLASPGLSLHDELKLMVESGLTAAEALRTATLNPARLFPSHPAGSIAAGQRADLVLLDANPLVDIRNTRRIRGVVLRGKFLDRKSLDQLLLQAAKLAETN